MNVSKGDQVILRIVTIKGLLGTFESKLIKKKLPRLVVTYPIEENEKFIRYSTRTLTKINAPIVELKGKNILSMGSIINVSNRDALSLLMLC